MFFIEKGLMLMYLDRMAKYTPSHLGGMKIRGKERENMDLIKRIQKMLK
jgi:hypothetical protein